MVREAQTPASTATLIRALQESKAAMLLAGATSDIDAEGKRSMARRLSSGVMGHWQAVKGMMNLESEKALAGRLLAPELTVVAKFTTAPAEAKHIKEGDGQHNL